MSFFHTQVFHTQVFQWPISQWRELLRSYNSGPLVWRDSVLEESENFQVVSFCDHISCGKALFVLHLPVKLLDYIKFLKVPQMSILSGDLIVLTALSVWSWI